MSFDIYGNNLKRGHCEVHPHVAEEYPCSVCVMEGQHREVAQSSQNEAWHLQDENIHLNAKIKELEDKYQTSCRSWRDLVQVKENSILELEQSQPKWISVDDELPEIRKNVLCIKERGEVIVDFRCFEVRDSGNSALFYRESKLYCGGLVTHWMPQPQPPVEQDQ